MVRDILVFSCYKGLAYVDVKKLKRSEISKVIDGGVWIFTKRKKIEALSRISVLPTAAAIIDHYAGDPQCVYKGYSYR